jgi:hypothetical protein
MNIFGSRIMSASPFLEIKKKKSWFRERAGKVKISEKSCQDIYNHTKSWIEH